MTQNRDDTVDVEELFTLLGNGVRMQIMRVLWERFDFAQYVIENDEGTNFATIREAAGVDDSGNFNYHLSQLNGTLIEQQADGYVLTPLGYDLMRTLDRYGDYRYATLEEWTVEDPCPFCSGSLKAQYRRQILETRCTDCGAIGGSGNFTFVELPAFGVRDLSRRELLDAAALALLSKVRWAIKGICWDCHAPMDTTLELCGNHDRGENGICAACDLRYQTAVRVACDTCGTAGEGPILEYVIATPAVAAFFDERHPEVSYDQLWRFRIAALATATEAVVATDPVTVAVTFDLDEASHRVTVRDGPEGVELDT
jgi:DNA-binding transcriptional ArsR family regulator